MADYDPMIARQVGWEIFKRHPQLQLHELRHLVQVWIEYTDQLGSPPGAALDRLTRHDRRFLDRVRSEIDSLGTAAEDVDRLVAIIDRIAPAPPRTSAEVPA